MVKRTLYLDYAATTPMWPGVVRAMQPYFEKEYGNPSSLHVLGEHAFGALTRARKALAAAIGAQAHEIYFTSGATESNNLALKGLWNLKKSRIITSAIEHPSIRETGAFLKKMDAHVVEIDVDNTGRVDLGMLARNLNKKTAVVSIIHANNVMGAVQDLKTIGKLCKKHNVLFHTDATQSFGMYPIDVRKLGIDLLSASAHKIGGPKGVGLLYVRDGVKLEPMLHGGGQERGLRSGTENVAGAVGFAKALEITRKTTIAKLTKLRDRLALGLREIGGVIHSSNDGLHNLVHVSFSDVDNEALVTFLSHRGIYVSAGSACDSKKEKEDHVLRALGLRKQQIAGSIRLSLGGAITGKDVDYVVREIGKAVETLKI